MEIARIRGFVGGVPERSKGADCKSAGSAFEGSNPSPSTRSGRPRGCSSMVEQKPSKLTTRVRFPSPAPAKERLNQGNSSGKRQRFPGPCSSVVEHSLGKGEVVCSIHTMGTTDPHASSRIARSKQDGQGKI